MNSGNYSHMTIFILVGLSSEPVLQVPLFYFFLLVYTMTVIGNLLLILTVRKDHRLHKPMYLFLCSLSFLDICSTSATVPNMLVNFLTGNKDISLTGCFLQVFLFLFNAETVCLLLAVMAYDRYVAICVPLHYCTIMKTATCIRMISTSLLCGAIMTSVDTCFLYQLEFCASNKINHFFCEMPSLIQLSCSDVSFMNIVKYLGIFSFLFVPLSFILYSYIHIIAAVFRIQSRRYKAFSTCVSHLTVVILFYGSAILTYMKPEHRGNLSDKIFSLFYTVITPMLNPFIYSLRNNEVHKALKNICQCIKQVNT